jgi:hypothetical protein
MESCQRLLMTKASVSQIGGKQTITPQPADSDSESDQANVNTVTSRQKGKGRAAAAPTSKSSSPPPSEAEWKMAKSWSSRSNKSLLANDPPSAAVWAQEKLAHLRDSTRAKADLEISVARAAAARAEESRKRKEVAVAKARSIQDKLDAARKARQQRFSPDMASSATATASSGTGPSSTSRVPVSTGPAPGSQEGSDAEMRGLTRVPTPGLASQPQSGDADNRSDVVIMYSEDGKLFAFQYNPKLDWDTELETRGTGPTSGSLN